MRAKILQSFLFVLLASILATSAYADVYIKTQYKNAPDFSKYGAKELHIIYASRFWSKGQDRELLPSKTRVTNYVAGKYANYTGFLVLDIEHWPLMGSDAQIKARVEKFITILDWVKSAAPKAKVGYYSVFPTGYWALQKPGSPAYRSWQHRNDLAKPLAARVDACVPNTYAVEANQANWVRAATAKISECKRLGGGKPILPFVNTRYRPISGALAFDLIPKDYFKLLLETVTAQSSNVVIWGGGFEQWSERLPWWQAAKEFLGVK